MSKAFTSEETVDDPVIVRARPPLPEGVPNYVTGRGLSALRAELDVLERERAAIERSAVQEQRLGALAARIALLTNRIGGAVVVAASGPPDTVRFGATVVLRGESGEERRYEIVGVDEADARQGRLAFTAPLARALLGRRVGESVPVQTPGAEREWELIEISYPEDAAAR